MEPRVQAAMPQLRREHTDDATRTELTGQQTPASTERRARQASTGILRETQTARPRHFTKFFEKHENEETRLQDPEGTGLREQNDTGLHSNPRSCMDNRKNSQGNHFHPESHTQTVLQVRTELAHSLPSILPALLARKFLEYEL